MSYLTEKIISASLALGAGIHDIMRHLRRGAQDTSGSTAIEYALMLGGIALGGTGLTATIGVEISSIFDNIGLEFCKMTYSVCR